MLYDNESVSKIKLHQMKLSSKEKDIEIAKLQNKCDKFEKSLTSVETKGKRITEKTRNFISEVKSLNVKVEKYQNKSKDLSAKLMQSNSEIVKFRKELDFSKKDRSKKEHELNLKEKRYS